MLQVGSDGAIVAVHAEAGHTFELSSTLADLSRGRCCLRALQVSTVVARLTQGCLEFASGPGMISSFCGGGELLSGGKSNDSRQSQSVFFQVGLCDGQALFAGLPLHGSTQTFDIRGKA